MFLWLLTYSVVLSSYDGFSPIFYSKHESGYSTVLTHAHWERYYLTTGYRLFSQHLGRSVVSQIVFVSNKPPLPHHTPSLYLNLCFTILVARSTTGLALSFTVSMSRDMVLSHPYKLSELVTNISRDFLPACFFYRCRVSILYDFIFW